MPLVATRALVLQAFPYSETSKILRLLTPAYGVCSVLARGALRPKSRFGGVLELFTEGDAQFFLKENRDLYTLSGFDVVRSRQTLGRNLVAFAGASLVAEMALRFGTSEAQPQLFSGVSTALDRIADAESELLPEVVIADVWLINSALGYRPQVNRCVTCDRDVQEEPVSSFDVVAGGLACRSCRPQGRPLDNTACTELRAMVEGQPITQAFFNRALQRDLLHAFLTAHLVQEHGLRSLGLFLQQLR